MILAGWMIKRRGKPGTVTIEDQALANAARVLGPKLKD